MLGTVLTFSPDELIDEDLMNILTNDSLSVPLPQRDTPELQPELTPAVVRPKATSENDSGKKSLRSIVQRPSAWLALWLIVAAGCCWFGLRGGQTASGIMTNNVAAVAQPKYETKAIQDIREGDIVMARDEFGNDLGMKRVVEVYRRTSDHLRILTFRSPDGAQQTLKTTNDHPFWIESRNTFVDAGELQVGETVTGPQGEIQTVASTIYEPHPEGIPVYNFQVEDYHTYFVQEHGARAPPVLVHNADYAAKVPKGHTRVYRAVSEGEHQDILQSGRLRQGPNSMEGKWFADTPEGARLHGDALHGPNNYRIIEADVPNNAPSLHLDSNLDGFGPARYLDMDDLLNITPRPVGG